MDDFRWIHWLIGAILTIVSASFSAGFASHKVASKIMRRLEKSEELGEKHAKKLKSIQDEIKCYVDLKTYEKDMATMHKNVCVSINTLREQVMALTNALLQKEK